MGQKRYGRKPKLESPKALAPLPPLPPLPPQPAWDWEVLPAMPAMPAMPAPIRGAVQGSFVAPSGARLDLGFRVEVPPEQGSAFGAGLLVGGLLGLGVGLGLYFASRED